MAGESATHLLVRSAKPLDCFTSSQICGEDSRRLPNAAAPVTVPTRQASVERSCMLLRHDASRDLISRLGSG